MMTPQSAIMALSAALFLGAADLAIAGDTQPAQKPAPVVPESDGIASADQALKVLSLFAVVDAEMAFCIQRLPQPDTYSAAHQEWLRRNIYLREQAFNVLTYRKQQVDEAALAAKAGQEVAANYAKADSADAACHQSVDDIWSGNADISATNPQLADLMYQSNQTLLTRHPDKAGAPG